MSHKFIEFILFQGPEQLTYSSKRKMSQRQRRTRVNQSTQTEEIYFQQAMRNQCELNGDGEYYEEQAQLYERLLKAEEVSI